MRLSLVTCASFAALGLMACPPPSTECVTGNEAGCDAGGPPPDFCNSQAEADADPTHCALTVTSGGAAPVRKDGVYISKMLDGGVDQDWYVAQLPALTPRSLVHISGGYQATQTAVNFQLNVLREGGSGLTSLATAVDHHVGGAAPKPVDIIFPFAESNTKLYVLAKDEGGAQLRFDNRGTYGLYVEVQENPDVNEPNDTTPTTIALAAGSSGQQGTETGYLATTDDVDLYEFSVSGSSRQIIYAHITEVGDHPTNPPPPYQLAYTLYDPAGTPISEGHMANAYLPIDLATARLAGMTGAYQLKVQPYHAPNDTTAINGDLRVQYSVEVRLMPDLDTQEPNDTAMTAKSLSLGANSTATVSGKLSYVADEEWFTFTLPSHATPSTLRYSVTAATSGGRFDPLTTTPNREINLVSTVTVGATAEDQVTNCKTNRAVCPRSGDGTTSFLDSFCDTNSPPQCLWAHREEELPRIPNLRNLTGAIPVTTGQANTYLIVFRDQGVGERKYADDRDYTLTVEWRDDADEAARVIGPETLPVSGTPSVATGQLSYGYGKFLNDGQEYFSSSDGLRARGDYDAVTTDQDLFQFNVTATTDQTWNVSWELMHVDGGTAPPGELGLELVFCTALGSAIDGGICTGEARRVFAYSSQDLAPWYTVQSFSNAVPLFSKTSTASSTTVTALPVGCECFTGARLAPGAYFINVSALHRTENNPLNYRITQSIAPFSCPGSDAGVCGFAP